MARKRDIEAYDRRVAAMRSERELEARDLGAIVTVHDSMRQADVTGVLVEVRHRIGVGLFGPAIYTGVTLCRGCLGPGQCDNTDRVDIDTATLVSIRRATPESLAEAVGR